MSFKCRLEEIIPFYFSENDKNLFFKNDKVKKQNIYIEKEIR